MSSWYHVLYYEGEGIYVCLTIFIMGYHFGKSEMWNEFLFYIIFFTFLCFFLLKTWE